MPEVMRNQQAFHSDSQGLIQEQLGQQATILFYQVHVWVQNQLGKDLIDALTKALEFQKIFGDHQDFV